MPLLKPQISAMDIHEILRENKKSLQKTESEGQDVRQIFNDVGLSLSEVAEQMAQIASRAEEETLRYKVLQDVLKIHGAMEPEESTGKNISISFNFTDSTVNPMGILIPR